MIQEDIRLTKLKIYKKDAKDFMIVKPICNGPWFIRTFRDKIDPEISRKTYMITYNYRYLRAIATKYLDRYFKFFILFDSRKIMDYIGAFRHLMGKGRFIRTSEIR
ncbi:MAG: hypothetical protein PHX70_05485 [Clostridium sp.]|nr:hypothetical protein [Clostridium sp.]